MFTLAKIVIRSQNKGRSTRWKQHKEVELLLYYKQYKLGIRENNIDQ